jgi:hypothetical protein
VDRTVARSRVALYGVQLKEPEVGIGRSLGKIMYEQ